MRSASNKQHVIDAWQTFRTRDAAKIAALFSESAAWLAPPNNATARALGGTHELHGRERIAHFIAVEFGQLFVRDVRVEYRGVHADHDVVVVEQTMSATLANGRHYQNDYCFVFELEDGLIKRVREYMDTARGERAIFGEG